MVTLSMFEYVVILVLNMNSTYKFKENIKVPIWYILNL